MKHSVKYRRMDSTARESHSIKPCPRTPNCVSSINKDRNRFVEPIKYSGDPDKAMSTLMRSLESFDNARIVNLDNNYIHAEFISKVFGFVDDVTFMNDRLAQTIHVKSESRKGLYDFGANRHRIETIRNLFRKGIKNET